MQSANLSIQPALYRFRYEIRPGQGLLQVRLADGEVRNQRNPNERDFDASPYRPKPRLQKVEVGVVTDHDLTEAWWLGIVEGCSLEETINVLLYINVLYVHIFSILFLSFFYCFPVLR